MPTLFRFFGILAALGLISFGIVVVLANFVQPQQREMSVPIPPDRFVK